MAEQQHELVIIRRRHDHEDSHHGGAWKIAFADFMTAMMALFLVLWLINSTSPKVKVTIARYFNPVKLVELTSLKKGFNDPVESEAIPGAEGRGSTPTDDTEVHPETGTANDGTGSAAAPKAKHAEAALFRDPYAVLAEIAAAGETQTKATGTALASDASVDRPDPFRDPFATIPRETASDAGPTISIHTTAPQVGSDAGAASAAPASDRRAPAAKADAAAPATAARSAAGKSPDAKAADLKAAAQTDASRTDAQSQIAAAAADAAKLQGEIAQAISKGAPGQPVPNVEVRVTDEGLLISLTDEQSFAMFAVGSAEPQAKTVRAMDVVAQMLKTRQGKILIRGFTDARPYKSATYDNWRLSSARAHMAQYMLIRGGLDEKRIAAIEGFADRRPKIAADPMAPENRRIEILLQAQKQ